MLQSFYEIQRREILATNWVVANNKIKEENKV